MYCIYVQIFNCAWLLAIDVSIRSRVDIEMGAGSKADTITLWNNVSVAAVPWFRNF
jgi:hypothetical protein